jgi:N-acetylmuramoyl-L-alanine amidase
MTLPHIATPVTSLVGLRFTKRSSTVGITVHCSASQPSANWGAVEIDRMHRHRGFMCIGYHLVIRRDGSLEGGRPLDAIGAHCADGGRNKTHIGICLVGGVSEKPQRHVPGNRWNGSDAECNFTPAQLKTLYAVLNHFKLPVEGHRDVKGVTKACPSFDVQHWAKTGEAKLG